MSEHQRRVPTSIQRVVVMLSILVVGPRVAAQAPGENLVKTQPFEAVPVDLNTGAFTHRLPFDVPFFITGQTLTGTLRLAVQFQEGREPLPESEADLDCVDESPWQPEAPLLWIPGEVPQKPADFKVLVGRLPVDRYFRFRFCFQIELTPEQLARFRESSRAVLDRDIQSMTTLTIPREVTNNIRLGLANAIDDVLPPRVKVTPGSVFSASFSDEALLKQFETRLGQVVATQLNRSSEILRRYDELADQLIKALNQIRSSPLSIILDEMQASTNDTVQRRLEAFAPAVALIRESEATSAQRAQGRVPVGPSVGFRELWHADPAAAYLSNYERLWGDLQALEGSIGTLIDDVELRKLLPKSLTPDNLPAMNDLRGPEGPLRRALNAAGGLRALLERFRSALASRDTALADLVAFVMLQAEQARFAVGTTTQNIGTNYNPYVSADAGLIYAPVIADATTYVGTNIYFRPVNKDAQLSQVSSFGRRFSLTFGLTLNSIEDTAQTRFNLFGNAALVMGAGLRVTQSLRLSGGALVFKERDANPLIEKKQTTTTPYVSVSFDLDVAKPFAGIGSLFKSQ